MVFAVKPIGDRLDKQRTFSMRGREDHHLEEAKRLQVPLCCDRDSSSLEDAQCRNSVVGLLDLVVS